MLLKGKKVLLTGATGFIGGVTAQALLGRGANLFCIVRSKSPKSSFYKLGLNTKSTILKCDLNNGAEVKKIIHKSNFDYIVHLAGVLRPKSMQEALIGNVLGTFNLIEAAKGLKNLKGIVLASSSRSKAAKITDQDIESLWSRPYDFSKTVSDLYAEPYFKNHKIPIVVIKYPNVFGAGDNLVKPLRLTSQIMEDYRNGKIFKANNNIKVEFAYVEDVAQAFINTLVNIKKYKYKTVLVKPLAFSTIGDWAKKIQKVLSKKKANSKLEKALLKTYYSN